MCPRLCSLKLYLLGHWKILPCKHNEPGCQTWRYNFLWYGHLGPQEGCRSLFLKINECQIHYYVNFQNSSSLYTSTLSHLLTPHSPPHSPHTHTHTSHILNRRVCFHMTSGHLSNDYLYSINWPSTGNSIYTCTKLKELGNQPLLIHANYREA